MKKIGDQYVLPCSIIRGGTSRGLYFLANDLPTAQASQDKIFKRIMGTPSINQIDGLGGATINTSKVAIVAPATQSGIDVNYTFAQIGIDSDTIDYSGTCGNLLAGVGVFALYKNLIAASSDGVTAITILNTNINQIITARIPTVDGFAAACGDYVLTGVGFPGAELSLDFKQTVGSKTGELLPTGAVVDDIELSNGTTVSVTICDVANPAIFVDVLSLGLRGDEDIATLDAWLQTWGCADELRAKVAVKIGMIDEPEALAASYRYIPYLIIVSRPVKFFTQQQQVVRANDCDVISWIVLDNRCYSLMTSTGLIALTAAAAIRGSVVQTITGESVLQPELRVANPSGVMTATTNIDAISKVPKFAELSITRSARLLMSGDVFVPETLMSC